MVESFRNFLDSLGVDWVLWMLLGLSVLSIAIIAERLIFFRRYYTPPDRIEAIVRGHLGRSTPEQALAELDRLPGMEARVLGAGFREMHRGPSAVEEILAGALASERLRYDRYLALLGTLGNNAPFIGLFGTVVGIVKAFRDLQSGINTADAAQNEAIMGSISEALVATAVGLLVAIPAVMGFNAFKNSIRRRASSTDSIARLLLAHLRTDKG